MEGQRAGVSLIVISLCIGSAFAALEISRQAAESIIDNLREHIFVDSRFISIQPPAEFCDSLSGPDCGRQNLAYSGIIPESFFPKGLEVEFDVFHEALPLHLLDFNYTSITTKNYVLPAPANSLVLRDLPGGGKITSHYSMSLPSGSGLAKLEGRWLLEDSVSMETFLPGYIKFSMPVLIKSLWAELTLPFDFSGKAPTVIVAFRLGKETVWTTEAIVEPGFTLDITSRGADGYGPLRACDQIVIYSTMKGLKIMSIDFEEIDKETLVPAVLLVPPRDKDDLLMLKEERVDASAIINRKIISIKEAIDNNYRMEFPGRPAVNGTKLVAEMVAKDIGVLAPVADVFRALKDGTLKLPHELKKAVMKNEKDVKKLVQSLAQRAVNGLVAGKNASRTPKRKQQSPVLTKEEARLQAINDLFIATLLHI